MESLIDSLKIYVKDEIKKKENLECFKTYLIEPVLCHIIDKIYPYIILIGITIILLLILVILIFISMMSLKKKI